MTEAIGVEGLVKLLEELPPELVKVAPPAPLAEAQMAALEQRFRCSIPGEVRSLLERWGGLRIEPAEGVWPAFNPDDLVPSWIAENRILTLGADEFDHHRALQSAEFLRSLEQKQAIPLLIRDGSDEFLAVGAEQCFRMGFDDDGDEVAVSARKQKGAALELLAHAIRAFVKDAEWAATPVVKLVAKAQRARFSGRVAERVLDVLMFQSFDALDPHLDLLIPGYLHDWRVEWLTRTCQDAPPARMEELGQLFETVFGDSPHDDALLRALAASESQWARCWRLLTQGLHRSDRVFDTAVELASSLPSSPQTPAVCDALVQAIAQGKGTSTTLSCAVEVLSRCRSEHLEVAVHNILERPDDAFACLVQGLAATEAPLGDSSLNHQALEEVIRARYLRMGFGYRRMTIPSLLQLGLVDAQMLQDLEGPEFARHREEAAKLREQIHARLEKPE